ncbi:MAG TPA: FAD-binding oxidoreductase [Gemmatimonas aurantiaca]|uniref:FAD-binding oxidoreductase n=3 Tax=Gemmatimonas aurantiaca TaxID=173480 RepID=A0A3D4V5C8_9BACT|nr:FAD-binding oxidoreductase [Gemmatimonas aurantiaca]
MDNDEQRGDELHKAPATAPYSKTMTDSSALLSPGPEGFRGPFRTDLPARALYAEGAGIARCVPMAVAVPADADDAATLVRWARAIGVGLMARGSGSGMAAGAIGPGIVVDLSRFTSIEEVDVDARSVRVGAGALRADVDAKARATGLRFPVDPSSGAFCTVGGMAATNAAGARTLRFGAMRPWVRGLHCVFDDGSQGWVHRDRPLPMNIPAVARLAQTLEQLSAHGDPTVFRRPGVRKESSGYGVAAALDPGGHLVDLLVGSEGTLALFTELELALTPVAGATATVMATFATLEEATGCAVEARQAGASACELLDRTFLDVAERGGPTGVPADAEAVLLTEVEGGSRDECAHNALIMNAFCRSHGAISVVNAGDKESERELWALRHAASPILSQLAPRLRSMQFIEDGCVPPEQFPAYVRGVREALRRFDTVGVIFGHAGDAHAHVNPLVDTMAAGWRDRVHGLLDTVCELTASLGGTLAGEHGDGRLRAPLLPRVWSPEARAAFANVKAAADPAGVLNPGCKITLGDPGDTDPIGVLRHDPEAPPLPSAVRAALDEVERSRRWHQFRLDLVPPA